MRGFPGFWQTEDGCAKSRNACAAGGAGCSANKPKPRATKNKMKTLKTKIMSLLGLLVIGATAAYGSQTEQPKMNGKLKVTTLSPEEIRYTGKPYNKELGAYVFNYRNYDPQIGRWTTPDASGFPDGANNEIYVSNHCLSFFDTDGLREITVHVTWTCPVTWDDDRWHPPTGNYVWWSWSEIAFAVQPPGSQAFNFNITMHKGRDVETIYNPQMLAFGDGQPSRVFDDISQY